MAARRPRSKRGAQRGAAARNAGGAPPSARRAPPDLVEIGRVERARGLDGGLLVSLHGEDPASLLAAAEVSLQGDPGCIPFRVLRAQDRGSARSGRARVELQLAGLASRELAREWTGARVSIARSALPELAEGEYYAHDLVGLEVRGADGRRLGRVQEIWPTPGHDVLVVATSAEPFLIPAVEPVLQRVDLEAGELWIDPPAGLVPGGEKP
jgi:16S rRNA processing protein RimM